MASSTAKIGRTDQKSDSVVGEVLGCLALVGVAAMFLLLHAAVAMTTAVPLAQPYATMRLLRRPDQVPMLAWVVWGALLAVLAVVGIVVAVLVDKRRTDRPGLGFATRQDVARGMSIAAVRKREGSLWPDQGRKVPDRLFGFQVGWLADGAVRKAPLFIGQEQHLMVIAPPGIGKTFRLVSRACMDAPGALMVTSTRDDILPVLVKSRAAVGRVLLFDPLGLVYDPDPSVVRVRWDLVKGCQDSVVARSRATRLVPEADNHTDPNDHRFFVTQARDAIAALLQAAALDGRDLTDFLEWCVAVDRTDAPVRVLRNHKVDPITVGIFDVIRNAPENTLKNVAQTITNAIAPLAVPQVRASVSMMDRADGPTATLDLGEFVAGRDTLLVVADENNPTDVGGVTTMLVGEVFEAAKDRARRQPTKRLAPPLRAVLDEVANICPLPKLPALLSDTRGYGVQIFFALQAEGQMLDTWGTNGARRLWDGSDLLVLGGLKDDDTLQAICRMLGQVDVRESSTQIRGGMDLMPSSSHQLGERSMIRPNEIRELPKGRGLLVSGTNKPALVDLPGWIDVPMVAHPDAPPAAAPTPAPATVAPAPDRELTTAAAESQEPHPEPVGAAPANPYLNLRGRTE